MSAASDASLLDANLRSMLTLPISKSWLVSETAHRVYMACAILTLALLGTWWGTSMAMYSAGSRKLTPAAATLVRIMLLPGVLGAGTLWAAMWYFWFEFDRSDWLKKAVWFLLLLLLVPVGSLFYYYFVYRRSSRQAGA